jgi:hypothetical protein
LSMDIYYATSKPLVVLYGKGRKHWMNGQAQLLKCQLSTPQSLTAPWTTAGPLISPETSSGTFPPCAPADAGTGTTPA